MIKYLLLVLLLVGLAYGVFEAWPLLMGPALSVSTPPDGARIPDGIVTITGETKRTASLSINGAQAFFDQRGNFSSTLTFPPGGSILSIAAKDRFGRSVSLTRSIFVP